MPSAASPTLVDALRSRADEMLHDVRALVEVESPTSDVGSCAEAVQAAAGVCARRLASAARVEEHDGRPVVRWGPAAPRVLLLGHVDTVWPTGTLDRWGGWQVEGDQLRGPGVFDMKAGAVQGVHALAAAADVLGPGADVGLLLTSDEEVGSSASRGVIAEACARAEAVLVLEPSAGGALKIARKGTSWYDLRIVGRAAHAGLDPASGVNALLAMARLAISAAELGAPVAGTTVTPTLAAAGTTSNTVPADASLCLDVRAWTPDEQGRVDQAVRALASDAAILGAATLQVGGGIDRPAMPADASSALLARAARLWPALGLSDPGGVAVGGASDGNLTADLGIPTLDGLGAVGDGAHADHEWASVAAMPERAALVAALVLDLLAD